MRTAHSWAGGVAVGATLICVSIAGLATGGSSPAQQGAGQAPPAQAAPPDPPGSDFLPRPPVIRQPPDVQQQLFLLPPGYKIEPVLTGRATAGELWAIQQVRVFETAGSFK